MCGVWDGNSGNDFQDRNGNIVGSPNAMGEAWRVSNDDGCPNPPEPPNPCEEVSRDERNWADQYCSRYKQEPFRSCPIDVTEYFKVGYFVHLNQDRVIVYPHEKAGKGSEIHHGVLIKLAHKFFVIHQTN